MRRKPVMFLSALALVTVGLTGCGDDSDGNGDAAEPTTASEETTTQEEPTLAEQETPTDEEVALEDSGRGAPTDSAADAAASVDDIDAPDPGPAPEGAVPPSGSLEDPPQTVAGLALDEGSRLPGGMYRDAAGETTVSVNPDNYVRTLEDYAGGLGDDAARGGTGVCGLNGSGTSIMCYQQTEDGISFISGDPEEVTVEDMVVFVNDLADQLGAA